MEPGGDARLSPLPSPLRRDFSEQPAASSRYEDHCRYLPLPGGSRIVVMNAGGRIAVLHFDSARIRGGVEEHMLTLLKGFDRARFTPVIAAHPELIELLRSDLPGDVEAFP